MNRTRGRDYDRLTESRLRLVVCRPLFRDAARADREGGEDGGGQRGRCRTSRPRLGLPDDSERFAGRTLRGQPLLGGKRCDIVPPAAKGGDLTRTVQRRRCASATGYLPVIVNPDLATN